MKRVLIIKVLKFNPYEISFQKNFQYFQYNDLFHIYHIIIFSFSKKILFCFKCNFKSTRKSRNSFLLKINKKIKRNRKKFFIWFPRVDRQKAFLLLQFESPRQFGQHSLRISLLSGTQRYIGALSYLPQDQ